MRKTKYVMAMLHCEIKDRLIKPEFEDDLDEAMGMEAQLVRVAEIIDASYELCLAELKIRVNSPDVYGELTQFNATGSIDRMTDMQIVSTTRKDLSPLQNLHHYLLRLLALRGLRKVGETLYQPVFIDAPGISCAATTRTRQEFSQALGDLAAYHPSVGPSTFATFFTENVSRQANYEAYLDATSSFRNRSDMIKQLSQEEEPSVQPCMQPHVHLIQQRNRAHARAVFPFDRRDQWQEIADQKNAEWSEFAKRCSDRLCEAGVDVAPFDMTSRVVRETGEALCIRLPTTDDATIKFIDESVDEYLFDVRFDGSNFAIGGDADETDYDPANVGLAIFAYLDDIKTESF